MLPTDGDHKKLLTEVIKKQIVILGPDITLAKARNVKGLTIGNDGTVTQLNGDPQLVTQQLVEQFMELSGLIVKKTMEPLLANYQNATNQSSEAPLTSPMPQTPTLQTPTPSIAPEPTVINPAVNPEPQTPSTSQQPTVINESTSAPSTSTPTQPTITPAEINNVSS